MRAVLEPASTSVGALIQWTGDARSISGDAHKDPLAETDPIAFLQLRLTKGKFPHFLEKGLTTSFYGPNLPTLSPNDGGKCMYEAEMIVFYFLLSRFRPLEQILINRKCF